MAESTSKESLSLTNGAEQSLEQFISQYSKHNDQKQARLSENDVRRISSLLQHLGQPSWAKVPRLYVILRLVKHVHLIDSFLVQGVSDIWFPFSLKTLPETLKSASARFEFIRLQDLVLTKAFDLEREDGKHRHFSRTEDVPLQKLAELGKGGFGYVDRVLSNITYREYARKQIPKGRTFKKNRDVLLNFERELGNLKKLSHIHIVEFVGSYTDPKFVGILMTPVADYNLKDFLVRDALSAGDRSFLRTFFGCLAQAVCYLHEQRVRHKDIKPENVLVKNERVYLTDFGISLDWSELDDSVTSGSTVKTPRYCAPEVAYHRARDSSSDMWSLGCVYLEMWTVLKGETLSALTNYMRLHGTTSHYYYQNGESASDWCGLLIEKGNDYEDNLPLSWICDLLHHSSENRLTAQVLVNRISEANEDTLLRYAFSGTCCILKDDSADSGVSSRRSSLLGEETGVSSIGVYYPYPNLQKAQDNAFVPPRLSSSPINRPTSIQAVEPLAKIEQLLGSEIQRTKLQSSDLSLSEPIPYEEIVGKDASAEEKSEPVIDANFTIKRKALPRYTASSKLRVGDFNREVKEDSDVIQSEKPERQVGNEEDEIREPNLIIASNLENDTSPEPFSKRHPVQQETKSPEIWVDKTDAQSGEIGFEGTRPVERVIGTSNPQSQLSVSSRSILIDGTASNSKSRSKGLDTALSSGSQPLARPSGFLKPPDDMTYTASTDCDAIESHDLVKQDWLKADVNPELDPSDAEAVSVTPILGTEALIFSSRSKHKALQSSAYFNLRSSSSLPSLRVSPAVEHKNDSPLTLFAAPASGSSSAERLTSSTVDTFSNECVGFEPAGDSDAKHSRTSYERIAQSADQNAIARNCGYTSDIVAEFSFLDPHIGDLDLSLQTPLQMPLQALNAVALAAGKQNTLQEVDINPGMVPIVSCEIESECIEEDLREGKRVNRPAQKVTSTVLHVRQMPQKAKLKHFNGLRVTWKPEKCRSCRKKLGGTCIQALGGLFHNECFRCPVCDKGFDSGSLFYPDVQSAGGEFKPFCASHYAERWKCGSCNLDIGSDRYIMAAGRRYHHQHFKCSGELHTFEEDNLWYEQRGRQYCFYHYCTWSEPSCFGCQRAILGRIRYISSDPTKFWHRECYKVRKQVTSVDDRSSIFSRTLLDQSEEARSCLVQLTRQLEWAHRKSVPWNALAAVTTYTDIGAYLVAGLWSPLAKFDGDEWALTFYYLLGFVNVLFTILNNVKSMLEPCEFLRLDYNESAITLHRSIARLMMISVQHFQERLNEPYTMHQISEICVTTTDHLTSLVRLALTSVLKVKEQDRMREAANTFFNEFNNLHMIWGRSIEDTFSIRRKAQSDSMNYDICCTICTAPIADDHIVLASLVKRWHLDHFRCVLCDKALDQDRASARYDEGFKCVFCAEHAPVSAFNGNFALVGQGAAIWQLLRTEFAEAILKVEGALSNRLRSSTLSD